MNAERIAINEFEETPPTCIPFSPPHLKREYHIDNFRFDNEEDKILAEEKADEIAVKKIGMDAFPEDIYNTMLEYLLSNGKFRDALLMVCAANLGMRFSDVVKLRFSHFFYIDGEFRIKFYIREKKTGKERPFFINEAVKAAMCLFCEHSQTRGYNDYLFTSESHNKVLANGLAKPISHTAAENIIKSILLQIGIKI